MKTTKTHFDVFRKECINLQKKFQLNGWTIYFKHGDPKNEASVAIDGGNYAATIYLGNVIGQDLLVTGMSVNQYLKKLAKHEMIHVLLGALVTMGESRYVNQNDMVALEEELVRKLITLIK